MKNVRIAETEDTALGITDRIFAELKVERQKPHPRPARDVIYKNILDALSKAKPSRRGKVGPQDILRLYYGMWIASRIHPVVEAVRRELFGSDKPPFRQWSDAQKWLVSEADLTFDEAMEVVEKAKDTHRALGLPDDPRFLSPLSLTYSPPGKPDEEGTVYFTPRSKLASLHKCVQLVTEVAGWFEEAALARILVGAVFFSHYPDIVRLSLALPDSSGVRYVDVRMWPWDLPDGLREDLTRRPLLKGLLKNSGPKNVHPRDAQLLVLMELEGYPPQESGRGRRLRKTAYWESLAKAWKTTYNQRVKPEALRKRWERMHDKEGDLPHSLRQGGHHKDVNLTSET